MKRDFDLMRNILLSIEEWKDENPLQTPQLSYEGFSTADINYNANLLLKSGYFEGDTHTDERGQIFLIVMYSLTMKGHDFLDDARDNTVWNKAKAEVSTKAASVSLAVFQELLKAFMKVHLGLP